uniref:Putative secreted protein n=1 Tax=Amblyomma parvum TaxID=251391 RepID=A0A023FYZ9_AMBPA
MTEVFPVRRLIRSFVWFLSLACDPEHTSSKQTGLAESLNLVCVQTFYSFILCLHRAVAERISCTLAVFEKVFNFGCSFVCIDKLA